MSAEKKSRPRRVLSPVNDIRQKRSSGGNSNGTPNARLEVDVTADPLDQDHQYDLTPVVSSTQDSRRPGTPSYSIDPWEVAVSPTSQVGSLDSGPGPHNIVDRTPGDGIDSPHQANFDDDQGDAGYDPDVDEDDELLADDSDRGTEIMESHVDGVARSSNPANRFLVPSDIRK